MGKEDVEHLSKSFPGNSICGGFYRILQRSSPTVFRSSRSDSRFFNCGDFSVHAAFCVAGRSPLMAISWDKKRQFPTDIPFPVMPSNPA